MKPKFFFAKVKSINTEERTIDVLASTADKDRDGDIILPKAFKKSIGSFLENPVILAGHQHRLPNGLSPVIGSAIPETVKITDKGLFFTMRFAKTASGEDHWILYRDQHQRAFSVGFIPEKWEDGKGRDSGRTYTQVELLEVSAVPVPSNPKAVARAKGYFDDDDTKDQANNNTKAINDLKDHIDDQFDEIKSLLLETDPEKFAKGLLGAPEDTNLPAGDQKSAERISDILNSF